MKEEIFTQYIEALSSLTKVLKALLKITDDLINLSYTATGFYVVAQAENKPENIPTIMTQLRQNIQNLKEIRESLKESLSIIESNKE